MDYLRNNQNKLMFLLGLVLLLVVGYCLYKRYVLKDEGYQGDASEGGGRGMTGRGLKGNRFLPEDYEKREENAYEK